MKISRVQKTITLPIDVRNKVIRILDKENTNFSHWVEECGIELIASRKKD